MPRNHLARGGENFVRGIFHVMGGGENFVRGIFHVMGGSESFVRGIFHVMGGGENFVRGIFRVVGGSENFVRGVFLHATHSRALGGMGTMARLPVHHLRRSFSFIERPDGHVRVMIVVSPFQGQ